jgi:plastocyanin
VPTKSVRAACASLAALCVLSGSARAQSLLDRPPNFSGGWVGAPGQLYFNFMHRFITSDAPQRKVTNFPTFTVAAGLPLRSIVGFHYSTNSQVAPGYPNEWEFFLRHALIQQERGAPVDLGAQVGYNLASDGVDGEVTVGRRQGPLKVVAAGRVLADAAEEGERRFAVGGGATLRVSRFFALAGDVSTLTERREGEEVAWSAGVHLAIPNTPHTLSLQATNTNTYTLQGLSRGDNTVRYGFEFTIPLTLSRWLRTRGGDAPAAPAGPPAPATASGSRQEGGVAPTGTVAKSGMRNLAFTPGRIEIQAGTTVEWTNNDPLAHTVTAADRSFDSGLVQPGATWRYTFTRPGTYDYACTPHPFMKGTVVVR